MSSVGYSLTKGTPSQFRVDMTYPHLRQTYTKTMKTVTYDARLCSHKVDVS